ncbi:MAG: AAA family ATPase [Paludibacteraceae bacterium]|nr:AAA family ATPase [Paludibacteraceae bacterium]
MKKIYLPTNGADTQIESEHSFVIIGANGSGKSHLGAWIEKKNSTNTLRISAQRALSVPDYITIKNETTAWNKILYGNEKERNKGYKWEWGKKETTNLINDYESVLEAIFARMANEKDKYFNECRRCEEQGINKPNTPKIITDNIIDIWNTVFPHRSIIFHDNTIKAKTDNAQQYLAKQMSDGERVAIYLMGQCLVAPNNTTIIIDEPEIHLHKAIMHKLWDKIEEYCTDKTFIYITHDLDFAASRKEAKKIWVKSYDMENNQEKWDIQIIEDHDVIPDELMIEVLGNRKDVLLVEGEKGSYDYQLYTHIYENHYIVPCHNCYKVIELTKAFNEERIKNLHNISVQGIIDRDYLSEDEIEANKAKSIYPLEVAEVENLFLLSNIQRIVAEHMALPNVEDVLTSVKTFLFSEFEKEKDLQITSICEREIQYKLSRFEKDGDGIKALKSQYESYVKSIDIDNIYKSVEEKVNKILADKDLDKLLMVYNRKSLHERVSGSFKLSKNEYPKLVLRLLKTEKKTEIINALRKHMPDVENCIKNKR